MASYIPENWPYGESEYQISYFGKCRVSETETACVWNVWGDFPFVSWDMGLLIARNWTQNTKEQQEIAHAWERATLEALSSSLETIQSVSRFSSPPESPKSTFNAEAIQVIQTLNIWNPNITNRLVLLFLLFFLGISALLLPCSYKPAFAFAQLSFFLLPFLLWEPCGEGGDVEKVFDFGVTFCVVFGVAALEYLGLRLGRTRNEDWICFWTGLVDVLGRKVWEGGRKVWGKWREREEVEEVEMVEMEV